ncbi:MAG: glycosyltransferase, partial [Bdellovibrionota bacterium]
VDYFYLGTDISNSSPQNELKIDFLKNSYFLSVGTIEPRKNHLHIMATFRKLWASGSDAKLVFVGRLGWKMEGIISEIEKLSIEYPDKFLWRKNVSDDELNAYYRNTKAVICASYDEGYGLPIVEALTNGASVICSDIPVFREIGSENCTYFSFDMESVNSLYRLLLEGRYIKSASNFKQITWQQAVTDLLGKIEKDALHC